MPDTPYDNLLLIAARSPVAGRTKTRLGATIGHDRAATLYRAFLHDLAGRFMTDPVDYAVGWAHTPESEPFADVVRDVRPDLAPERAIYVKQDGPDWSVRQANLLRWGAEHGYVRTILTASDSPHMSREVISDAFAALDAADVVLGRVHDGGYYLIGLRGFHDVLTGVAMSTTSAADALVERAEAMGLRVATVEPLFDVDVEDDLQLLSALCREHPEAAPETAVTLRNLGLCMGSIRET